jgi:hypothetical protein
VANEFTSGGNGIGNKYDLGKHFEMTNTSTMTHGAQTFHFGVRARRDSDQNENPQDFNGTFSFQGGNGETALQQYAMNLQLAQQGYSQSQIQAMGYGPNKFSIQGGLSYVSMTRWDAAPFVQDDWRLRPNFTLSLGLRYEVQNLVSDNRDWAPRIGFAFAPGSTKNGPQKTVIRGGVGIFYDRISFGPYENAYLNNGVNQLEYTVDYPTFFPNIPSLSTLSPGTNTINLVDPKLRAEYSVRHRRRAPTAPLHHGSGDLHQQPLQSPGAKRADQYSVSRHLQLQPAPWSGERSLPVRLQRRQPDRI